MRNFEKMAKRNTREHFEVKDGRKLNKTKRDRSHKRNWEAQ